MAAESKNEKIERMEMEQTRIEALLEKMIKAQEKNNEMKKQPSGGNDAVLIALVNQMNTSNQSMVKNMQDGFKMIIDAMTQQQNNMRDSIKETPEEEKESLGLDDVVKVLSFMQDDVVKSSLSSVFQQESIPYVDIADRIMLGIENILRKSKSNKGDLTGSFKKSDVVDEGINDSNTKDKSEVPS